MKKKIRRAKNCISQIVLLVMEQSGRAHQEYPSLENTTSKLNSQQIHAIIKNGSGRMPSFQHLRERDRNAIVDFVLNKETNSTTKSKSKKSAKISEIENHAAKDSITDSQRDAKYANVFPYNSIYIKKRIESFFGSERISSYKTTMGCAKRC